MLLELLAEPSHSGIQQKHLPLDILSFLDFIHLLHTTVIINPLNSLIKAIPHILLVLDNVNAPGFDELISLPKLSVGLLGGGEGSETLEKLWNVLFGDEWGGVLEKQGLWVQKRGGAGVAEAGLCENAFVLVYYWADVFAVSQDVVGELQGCSASESHTAFLLCTEAVLLAVIILSRFLLMIDWVLISPLHILRIITNLDCIDWIHTHSLNFSGFSLAVELVSGNDILRGQGIYTLGEYFLSFFKDFGSDFKR